MVDIPKIIEDGPPIELIEGFSDFIRRMNTLDVDSRIFAMFLVTAAKRQLVGEFGKKIAADAFRHTADYIESEGVVECKVCGKVHK